MNRDRTGVIVISLGGSLIVPDVIDVPFLKKFIALIQKRITLGERFVLITGGGKICRNYQKSAGELGVIDSVSNDWIGIYTTRLNGEFLRILFGDLAYKTVVCDPRVLVLEKSVTVVAGEKPGQSTDSVAVEIAKKVGAKHLINLSNVDFIYDKDPKFFADAKRLEKTSWADFQKIMPKDWQPGMHFPFDPIATKVAEEEKIEVAFMNGKDLVNVENYLDGTPFIGTLIS